MGILRDTQLNSAKKAMNVYSLQQIWGVSLNKCFLATPRKSVADVLKITSNKWSKKTTEAAGERLETRLWRRLKNFLEKECL